MKELTFENGTPHDTTQCEREGHTIINRPGANPICRVCGTINPHTVDNNEDA